LLSEGHDVLVLDVLDTQVHEVVVPVGVSRRERAALVVARLRAAQALAARVRQGADGGVEALAGEAVGLARARPEPRTPEEPLGLGSSELTSVDGGDHRAPESAVAASRVSANGVRRTGGVRSIARSARRSTTRT
jgi:hypothetical protein